MDKRDQQPRTRHANQEVQTDASDHPQPILATAVDRQSEIPLDHHNAHRLRSRRQRRYPHPQYFNKQFRKVTGNSPSRYRDDNQEYLRNIPAELSTKQGSWQES
jgi:hypothetical protein